MTIRAAKHRATLFALLPLGMAALVTSFGACGNDAPVLKALAEGCLLNTDCNAPLICAFRKCHQACTASRDCPAGQRCVASDRPSYVCQLADERNCVRNSDCVEGQVCGIDQQCRDQCVTARDCLRDQVCTSGTCADLAEFNGDLDGGLAGADGPAETSTGQPCLYTSECPMPLVCLSNVCSYECLAAADCVAGEDCVNNRCTPGSGTLIGTTGGTVTAAGGKLSLTIPAGALRSDVAIAIVPLEAWPEGALGLVVDIQPSGLLFTTPASLTYHYEAAEIGSVADGSLHLATAVGSNWIALTSMVDSTARTVTASLEHLSVYGLISLDAPAAAPAQPNR